MEKQLRPEQHRVLREGATEPAFTSPLLHESRDGMFRCAGCDTALFTSTAKFDSGTGWPSFDQALPGTIVEKVDSSFGMKRTEILCAKCNGHLGHVFDDGPTETGLRYCTNGCALDFSEKK